MTVVARLPFKEATILSGVDFGLDSGLEQGDLVAATTFRGIQGLISLIDYGIRAQGVSCKVSRSGTDTQCDPIMV